jgi:LacI family transcriptional regulator
LSREKGGAFFQRGDGFTGRDSGSERPAAKGQKIRTIGVLCSDGSEAVLRHSFYAGIIERFKSMVERHGFDVFFLSNQIGRAGISYCDHLALRNADGVFIVSADYTAQSVRELLLCDIPKIAVDYADGSTGCVMTDCDKSMALIYNHLYDLGHRNIVYMHGEPGYLTDARINGLKSAAAVRGAVLPAESFMQSKYYSLEAGYACMKQALARSDRPTAVIASDDCGAIGAVSAARDMGLSVPEDVSVAGFDGFEAAQYMSPKLTTIKQDTMGLGTKAAENLIKQILRVGDRGKPEIILLEPKLIIGDSCRNIS